MSVLKPLNDSELQEYYEALFVMYGTPGWKKLMEDVGRMLEVHNSLAGLETAEQLWFRIDGQCPASDKPGWHVYGCFSLQCRTVDTNLGYIGPQSVCTPGAPMSEWSADCWNQFYAVLGHEVMHGWLGRFHS